MLINLFKSYDEKFWSNKKRNFILFRVIEIGRLRLDRGSNLS